MLDKTEIKKIEELCKENRRNIIKMVHNAQSGHIGGSLSATEIMTVLFHKCMQTAPKWKNDPNYEKRDRFVLSKGHASPIYYSVLSQLGYFPKKDLMTFRIFGTLLQGHPAPFCPGVEVATGSLGQGLSAAVGMALAAKIDRNPATIYCFIGDGESQEGQIWEASMFAGAKKLDNLIVLLDSNRMQLDGPVESINGLEPIVDKWKAFNFFVQDVDGHDLAAISDAIDAAKAQHDKPSMIVLRTVKGKGASFTEGVANCHSMSVPEEVWRKETGRYE